MSTPQPCEELNGLLKSGPSATDRNAIAAHIAGCPVCQQTIVEVPATIDFQNPHVTAHGTWRVLGETTELGPGMLRAKLSGANPISPPSLPGYEVLEELGRGGMG